MIDYVTEVTYDEIYKSFLAELKKHDTGNYLDFYRLHDPLTEYLNSLGAVAEEEDGGDFGHGGDWYKTVSDGFFIRTSEMVAKIDILKIQSILNSHSPHSMVFLEGDLDGELSGLEIMLHPKTAVVCWRGYSANETRKKLSKLKLNGE